jgi:hypothetical protein
MSEVERRDVLIASVGLATAALAVASPAQAGDSSFMNNVPDPLLSGAELPTSNSLWRNPKEKSSAIATAKRQP